MINKFFLFVKNTKKRHFCTFLWTFLRYSFIVQYMNFTTLFENQRYLFHQNVIQNFHYRQNSLEKLKKVIQRNEKAIIDCLHKDLQKPKVESLSGEVYFLLEEIRFAQKNLKLWMNSKKVRTPLFLWRTKSYEVHCPLGVILIISPWNYPFRLSLSPLIGALSAGNCAVLKTSEHSPHSSQLLYEMISEAFSKNHVAVVKGGIQESQKLLEHPFDHIFFTGNPQVGKLVLKAASQNLSPVTLELGGVNPSMVHRDAHLKSAVSRLAWSKFLNNGQTCLAPNFVCIHKDVRDEFLKKLKSTLKQWFGQKPEESCSLSRIVNRKHFQRLQNYLKHQEVYYGGNQNEEKLFLEPTLILNPSWESPCIHEEIFGPILPILEYTDFQKTFDMIKLQGEPLTSYLFSRDKKIQNQFIKELKCGSCVINDAVLHANNFHLPFGGVKNSGWGAYHGRHSFETFSHKKAVMKQLSYYDFEARYPPYTEEKVKFLKRIYKNFRF